LGEDRAELVIQLVGSVPVVGEEMRSVHSYLLADDLELGSGANVDVDFARKPRKWGGWRQFEALAPDVWIFGYGSLVDPDDVERYVGFRPVEGMEWAPAVLNGYERAWNVGMHNIHDRDDDKFYTTVEGERYKGIVLTLGLESNRDMSTNGLVFRIEPRNLAKLDSRERRYDRVDVTTSITTSAHLNPGSSVHTYIPNRDALATGADGMQAGTGAVSRSYHDKVAHAFAQLGEEESARYVESTRESAVPLVDLQIIRPGTKRHSEG
jgi:cation transport regulator ChaC